jgi:peptide/nickel transport system substrate-binding protein
MRRRWIFLAFVFPLVLTLAASVFGRELRINQGTATILFMDPHKERSSTGLNFLFSTIFETLLTYGKNMEIEPMLATSWKISGDGTVWTLTLRKGIKFHDGTSFDAEAVKFNFERVVDPQTKAVRGTYFASLIKSVEALDNYTVKITLKAPYAAFAPALTIPDIAMVSPAAIKKYGPDFSNHPVGTGPFMLKEWKRENYILLERNPSYWKAIPKTDIIRITQIREESTIYAALKSEEIDVEIVPPPEFLKDFEADPRFVVTPGGPKLFFEYYGFNNERPPFNDKKVRQAVSHAINNEAIVKFVDMAYGKQICQPMGPTVWGYDPSAKCVEYNPEKATRMLAEAGWRPGPDGILEKEGKKFVIYANIIDRQERRFEVIQNDLKKVDIDLKLQKLEWGAFLDACVKGEFDIFNLGRDYKTGDADVELYSLFHSSNIPYINMARYRNSEVDKLLEKQRTEMDKEKRLKLINEITSRIMDDMPLLPSLIRMTNTITSKKVKNFYIYPNDRIDLLTVTVD